DVPRDVPDPFVPHAGAPVDPAVSGEDRVDVGPADLRVPEPERGKGGGPLRPLPDVGLIPGRQALRGGRVARKTRNAVRAVYTDGHRSGPPVILPQRVPERKVYPVPPVGRPVRAREALVNAGDRVEVRRGRPARLPVLAPEDGALLGAVAPPGEEADF